MLVQRDGGSMSTIHIHFKPVLPFGFPAMPRVEGQRRPKFMRRPWLMMPPASRWSSPRAAVESFSRHYKRSKHRLGSTSIDQCPCSTCTAHLVCVHNPSRIV
ncbi:hypothetical protein K437DRAFT_9522 [Tilletiaria anomala UBC 951]|uniref:Uncharacterized protein n=1 Tax=Tilletiaria anomala (strain ATCC 24038 / CBS 436.72 / UBC 951) TaxID=1037660 RepID=A0A066VCY1_TILAU|nr:uncharacterized protein K437DRAFT_9522 [Tilletiaria anomala UBC 951]KDN39607.1 hypothetical protein K437DRAFT_9522 [Tilletiaria anomala UBC 951]